MLYELLPVTAAAITIHFKEEGLPQEFIILCNFIINLILVPSLFVLFTVVKTIYDHSFFLLVPTIITIISCYL